MFSALLKIAFYSFLHLGYDKIRSRCMGAPGLGRGFFRCLFFGMVVSIWAAIARDAENAILIQAQKKMRKFKRPTEGRQPPNRLIFKSTMSISRFILRTRKSLLFEGDDFRGDFMGSEPCDMVAGGPSCEFFCQNTDTICCGRFTAVKPAID